MQSHYSSGAIRKIESKGKLESARQILQLTSAVFRYASAPTVTHYGAVTDARRVRELSEFELSRLP